MDAANRIIWALGIGCIVAATVTLSGPDHLGTCGLGIAGLAFWLYASVGAICKAITKGRDR